MRTKDRFGLYRHSVNYRQLQTLQTLHGELLIFTVVLIVMIFSIGVYMGYSVKLLIPAILGILIISYSMLHNVGYFRQIEVRVFPSLLNLQNQLFFYREKLERIVAPKEAPDKIREEIIKIQIEVEDEIQMITYLRKTVRFSKWNINELESILSERAKYFYTLNDKIDNYVYQGRIVLNKKTNPS
ncbi:hypothetical protein J0X14_18475 [Muricauda sp. CAU 1633]|uniref:hypothetical protein n=1 Tax=Allomuricauda sp. CAU 1633 TaxID=2816036 RepID=UPI001A8F6F3C|nr:hypothetical protein [Muricauda sp. CAU 1633]MBO0324301.1 hypothetical protein [Muricauda sp. CAU 1633]